MFTIISTKFLFQISDQRHRGSMIPIIPVRVERHDSGRLGSTRLGEAGRSLHIVADCDMKRVRSCQTRMRPCQ